VCLLIVLAQMHRELPLVVAGNRDELLDRPAIPMAILRDTNPRIVGGRDELAGGTWLAVNDAGVVAGLTNRPATKDPTRRSRGELPIALTSHASAAAAVDAFVNELRPSDYNPAWLLVGDRESIYAVDMTGEEATVERLPPGIHVLENRALGEPSPKVDHVRGLVEGVEELGGAAVVERLQAVVADHHVPEGATPTREGSDEPIPAEVKAACVHTERYGTRWSGIVTVSAAQEEPPVVQYADGPPCRSPWTTNRAGGAALWPTDRHRTGG
jgi:uncharacterized protein with NRDE domain